MKKNFGCTVISLVIATNIWGDQVKPGQYSGLIMSIKPDTNESEWKVNITLKNGYNIANAEMLSSNSNIGGNIGKLTEQWTWNENTLEIIEQYQNTGARRQAGGAALQSYIKKYGAKNENGKYIINCKNRESGDCDGGMDSKHYWKIIVTDDGFIWESWGVPQGQTSDPIKMDTWMFKPKL